MNNSLVPYVQSILTSVFALVLGVRLFGHWMKSEWGKFFTTLAGAAIVAWAIWFPNDAVTLLKLVGSKLTSILNG